MTLEVSHAPTRVTVLGLGAIGRAVLKALLARRSVRVVAVGDPAFAGHDAGEAALAACNVVGLALRDHLEVRARREHVAPARQHDGAQRGVGFDLVEQGGHRLAHLGTDRVAGFGAVEREERDVIAPFQFHDCHGRRP